MPATSRAFFPLLVAMLSLAATATAFAQTNEAEWEYRERPIRKEIAGCKLPKPGPAKIALITTMTGSGVPSHAIDDDGEDITTIADLRIEPGKEPLYVLIGGRHTMWRVTGAVERVAAIVLSKGSGVIGVDRSLVHSVAEPCVPSLDAAHDAVARLLREDNDKSAERQIALARSVQARIVEELIGAPPAVFIDGMRIDDRNPNAFFLGIGVSSVDIPSGKRDLTSRLSGARPVPEDGDVGTLWRRFMEMHPGGVVDIDPSMVVTAGKLTKYETLPEEAGFAQLIAEGAIEPVGWRDAVRSDDGSIAIGRVSKEATGYFRVPFVFRVHRALRLPPHPTIYSLRDPRFLVPAGVPDPTGADRSTCIRPYPVIGDPDGPCPRR